MRAAKTRVQENKARDLGRAWTLEAERHLFRVRKALPLLSVKLRKRSPNVTKLHKLHSRFVPV